MSHRSCNEVTQKGIARKRKINLEVEELASAVKETEEYERQQDVYISTQDTSLQPHTKKRKLTIDNSSMKPTSSFMEMELPLFNRRQLEFDQDLIEMLTCANLPFSFVGNKGFRKSVSKYVPKFTIMYAITFSRNKIPLLYNEVKNAVDSRLEAKLPEYKGVAFTTDMWTSCNNDSYISITLHYIDKDFNQKNVVVG